MAVQPRLKGSAVSRSSLFTNNLTPSRDYLVRTVRQGIATRRLRTSDLMLLFMHLREIGFYAFAEWGNSVAHIRRNRGALWKRAVDIWAAQLYFKEFDWKRVPLARLPVHAFDTFLWVIDYLSDWQFREEFEHIYSAGITRDEAKATLHHLYSPPAKRKDSREPDERSGFIFLVNQAGIDARDLAFIRKLIRLCDVDAMNVPPEPLTDYLDHFEDALRTLGVTPWRLNQDERIYLQLHFLICLHHTIIDLDYHALGSIVKKPATAYTAMLAVSAMRKTLSLDIGFYFRDHRGYLEQVDLASGDERYPNLSYPVMSTDLPEKTFVMESDENILACLFNHPLDVRCYGGQPHLIALDRSNSPFRATRYRTGPRNRPGSVADFLETFGRP